MHTAGMCRRRGEACPHPCVRTQPPSTLYMVLKSLVTSFPAAAVPPPQVFRAVTDLLQALSNARVPKASSGLELLLRQAREQQAAQQAQQQLVAGGAPAAQAAAPALPAGPPGPEATRAHVAAAWECLQRECQRLLADVLDVAPPAVAVQRDDEGDNDVPLAGWLAAVGFSQSGEAGGGAPAPGTGCDSPAAAAQGTGALSFSLVHEVEGLLSRAADGGAAVAGCEPAGRLLGAATREAGQAGGGVRTALGGWPGSPALVASLYRPVLQFAEAAERHVAGLIGAGGGGEQGGRMAALLPMPWRAGGGGTAPERAPLRSFVETFLRMEFLPAVYVSARCEGVAALPAAVVRAGRGRTLLLGCGTVYVAPAGTRPAARWLDSHASVFPTPRAAASSPRPLTPAHLSRGCALLCLPPKPWHRILVRCPRARRPRRARCSATLEDPAAFKPRTRLRAPYRAGAGHEGRPILPAALAAEEMVEELLGWAALVPPFATHLTGASRAGQRAGRGVWRVQGGHWPGAEAELCKGPTAAARWPHCAAQPLPPASQPANRLGSPASSSRALCRAGACPAQVWWRTCWAGWWTRSRRRWRRQWGEAPPAAGPSTCPWRS